MTVTQVMVGIGEIQIVQGDGLFTCVGLGSCIGLYIFDSEAQVCGMAHFMLPKAFDKAGNDRPAKFADTGMIAFVEMLERLGGKRENMRAVMAGGARVLSHVSANSVLDFGVRNAEVVKEYLRDYRITLVAEETGGTKGRTFTADTLAKKATVRSAAEAERVLCRLI